MALMSPGDHCQASLPPRLSTADQQGTERVILLALIGSGLRLAELLRLHVGDVGSLDAMGVSFRISKQIHLAVQYTPRRGKQVERITFLTYSTRQALLLLATEVQSSRMPHSPSISMLPLIAQRDGSKATVASVARARQTQ